MMTAPEHDGCCEEYRVNEPAPKCHNCPRLTTPVERARRASEIVRRKPERMESAT